MKFSGSIGFIHEDNYVEIKPGVFKPEIVEKIYNGDVNWDNRHFANSGDQNEDIKLNSQISIISDLYFQRNLSSIRYIIWNGIKWRVTNVTVGYPRCVLTVGGVYNGSGAKETSST